MGEHTGKWLVTWDFHPRPSSNTFHKIFAAEFKTEAALQWVNKNTFIAADDFTARRLVALIKEFEGEVITFSINGRVLDDPDGEGLAFVGRVRKARLARRGHRTDLEKGGKRSSKRR